MPIFRQPCSLLALATIAGAAMLPAALARADDPVTLRYSFRPGQQNTYRWTFKMDQETSGGMFGKEGMKSDMQSVLLWKETVKSAAEDANVVEYVYGDMKTHMNMPMQAAVFFDSTSPEFKATKRDDMDMMTRMASSTIGKGVTLTLDPRGRISKVEKNDAFKAMSKEIANEDPSAANMFEQMFGDESLRKTFQQFLVTLPDKPVKPGDTWTSSTTITIPMLGSIKYSTVWTYAGEEKTQDRALAKITGAITMESVPGEAGAKPAGLPPGMDMKMEVKGGKGTTTALFDPKAGRIWSVLSQIDMPATMTMKMPPAGGEPGQTMVMNMKTVSTTSLAQVAADAPLDPDNIVKKPAAAPKPRPSKPGEPGAKP